MRKLILVVTSQKAALPNAQTLEEQFNCETHTIDLDEGMDVADSKILDAGFTAIMIEMTPGTKESLGTPNSDIAFILRELRARESTSPIILMGPQSETVKFARDFAALTRAMSIYFVDPTDDRRHPDEMNRVLYSIFPKKEERQRQERAFA